MKAWILLPFLFICLHFSKAQNNTVFVIDTVPPGGVELNQFWKFHSGDNADWASSDFDDNLWDTINTAELNAANFTGIGWFRIHLGFDSSLSSLPLALGILQTSASEIYFNGRKLMSLGKVSTDAAREERYSSKLLPTALNFIPGTECIIAVRYSNHKQDSNDKGFNAFIIPANEQIVSFLEEKTGINSISSVFLFGFIVALGIAHLFIFLFYKANKSNLFYFFFAALLSIYALTPFFEISVSSASLFDSFENLTGKLFPIVLTTLIILVYSIFYERFPKVVWYILSLGLINFILTFLQWEHKNIIIYIFVVLSIIEVLRVVITALIKKKQGSLIIGIGTGIFIVLVSVILLIILFPTDSDFSRFWILFVFAIMSIPVSMSLYLAKQFAATNNDLKRKLTEVEYLSAKNLEQEKEKQKILETQKETLEIQVKERTQEIVEQKTIIEEKNKDITDSIDYAKTIQDAILPDKELKNKYFPDSFILFKPKDIVSGDFYWFTEKDGKRLIAACDCTGHGVPGALMSMIGNNILNQIVNEKGITSPDEILNQLHKEIRKTLKQENQNEAKDGMDIAVIAFNSTYEIEFAGAQRPLWIIKGDGILTLTEIKGDKFAIGGMQEETERKFTNHKITLTENNSCYIFSDGFADQFSVLDKKLMTGRFKQTILSINQKSMPEQELFLNNFIEDWRGAREQIDDILVIGIRI